jgi:16S rRNA (uracil1498-N3)-methyltransferase
LSSHYFILDPSAVSAGGDVVIDGQNARHISKVLRLRVGDHVSVSDGESMLYDVEIKSIGAGKVSGAALKSTLFTLPEKNLTVFQGLPKGRKMDLIVEKLTEVGVEKIVPVVMSRSIPEYGDDRKAKRSERWRTIAAEASKQSKRMRAPEVDEILTWEEALKLLSKYDSVLVPYEGRRDQRLDADLSGPGNKYAVFIGPEGGFEESEITTLEGLGANTFSLGDNILRTETAAIVAAALILDRINR